MTALNLPPLPPIPGDATGRNVVDVVTEQHDELLDLGELLAAAPHDQRLAGVVIAALSRHLSAEEQYLYPAVRLVVPGGEAIADRELAEDHELLITLKRLADGEPVAAGLVEGMRRHVAADAEELLPVLVAMAPVDELIRVGNRFETAQEAAPTRPHPSTPSTPPWNKVVDPAVAVLDKVRDAVTGRATYPKDLNR
ncbi:hemerythrin domain-containing protein [Actinoplanes sp. TBRC 11911]|uniref:hemerythrin domain-containing protein n=1 Tax=Actinoplanes sp. TBRC 11911 TaxID=2729386 RepID=UPI0028A1799A|nr:hemerythrin domain-containing protein [Actinoplanes sp. TBRC 11911]